jgi:moderate conductance mechanosensitive channel
MKGLGFNPIPLLAGAGVLGLVVGFGTQSLINDLVSGFFIIFEYTFQVGDYVEVNKASGVVESIGLRTTSIRSDNGELHILQNGKLGDVVNHSHEYTNAVVNVGVSYKTDLQRVYAVLNDLGKVLHTEMDDVLKPTEVAGVVDFSGPEIIIRTVTRVRPGRHKPIAREIRRRIIDKFQEQGIVIPFKNRFKFA